MSSVDERVVRMEFDNKQFENGVQTTMSTLEKFKAALNFRKASSGFDDIQRASNSVDFSALNSNIVQVQQNFSFMGEFVKTVFDRISNRIIDVGARLGRMVSVEPIMSGFSEYETQMNAVQTIMANTQAAFADATTEEHLAAVNGALDELNTYADKTIYNFTEMTRNIGTFTAAGVDLDTAKSAIQGIANLAAVSGSNAQQASTAMYQLSQAIAAGSVKLMDWNSVVNAGMGGQVFQDALKKTAREHGIAVDELIAKHGSFRESLQEGWITAEVLTDTLEKMTDVGLAGYFAEVTGKDEAWIKSQIEGIEASEDREAAIRDLSKALSENGSISEDAAKEYLDLMFTAQDAATKVKTFSQLIDTVKESLGSGWTQSMEYIIGDFEEAKALWSAVYSEIESIIGPIADARNEMLKFWHDNGGRSSAINAFSAAWDGIKSIVGSVRDAFRSVFPPLTGKQLVDATKKVEELAVSFRDFVKQSEFIGTTTSIFKSLFGVIKMGADAARGVVSFLAGAFNGFLGTFQKVASSIVSNPLLSKIDGFVKSLSGVLFPLEEVTEGLNSAADAADSAVKKFDAFKFGIDIFNGIVNAIKSFADKIVTYAKKIGEALPQMLEFLGSSQFRAIIGNFNSLLAGKFVNSLSGFVDTLRKSVEKKNDIQTGFKALFDSILNVFGNFKDRLEGVIDTFDGTLGSLKDALVSFSTGIKATALLEIAIAVGILAGSLAVLANIDVDKMANGIVGIAALMGVLVGAFMIIGSAKSLSGGSGLSAMGVALIEFAVSVQILAKAMALLSTLSMDELVSGLVGLAGIMLVLVAGAAALSTLENDIGKSVSGIIGFAIAIRILAVSVKDMSSIPYEALRNGLTGVGLLLAEVAVFSHFFDKDPLSIKAAMSIILLSAALNILVPVASAFSSMSKPQLIKGLGSVAVLLGSIAAFSHVFENGSLTVKASVNMLVLTAAIKMLESSAVTFANMGPKQFVRGLGGVLGLLASLVLFASTAKNIKLTVRDLAVFSIIVLIAKQMQEVVTELSKLSSGGIKRGIVGFGAMLLALGVFSAALKKHAPSAHAAGSIAVIASGIKALSEAFSAMGKLRPEQFAQGVKGAAAALLLMVAALTGLGRLKSGALVGAIAFTVVAVALNSLVPVIQTLSQLSIPELGTGLLGLAGALAALGVGAAVIGKFLVPILKASVSIAAFAASVAIFGASLSVAAVGVSAFAIALATGASSIDPKGLISFAAAITIMVVALKLLGTVSLKIMAGAAALTIVSIALYTFIPILQALSELSLESIIGGLIGLAGGLAILAGGSLLLSAISAPMLVAASAVTLFSVACIAAGASMLVIAAGVTALSAAFNSDIGVIVSGLATVGRGLSNFVVQLVVGVLDGMGQILFALGGAIRTIGDFIIAQIPYLMSVVGELVIAVFGALDEIIPRLGGALVKTFVGLMDSIANGIRDNSEAILSAIRNILSSVIELVLTALAEIVSTIPGFGDTLAGYILDGREKVRATLAPESFSQMTGEAVNSAAAGAQAGAPVLGAAMEHIGQTMHDSFAEGAGSGEDVPTELIDTALAAMQGRDVDFAEAGGLNIESYINPFASATAEPEASDLAGTAVEGLASQVGLFGSTGTSEGNAYSSGLGSVSAYSSGASVAGTGVSGAESKYNGYYSAGEYGAEGFGSGLSSTSAMAYVASAAASLATKALDTLKATMDEHSPSKKTMKIGRYASEGFAIGISSLTGVVYKDAAKVGNSAIDGIRDSLGEVSKHLDDELDMTPVIRPVMDLSEIQNGVSKINGMVDGGVNSLSSGVSLSAYPQSMIGAMSDGAAGMSSDMLYREIRALTIAIENIQPSNIIDARGMSVNDSGSMSLIAEDVVNAFIRRGLM